MATEIRNSMTDGGPRGLVTEREQEVLLGNAEDITDGYERVVVHRVRQRINRLSEEIEALEAHGELADELREVVCDE